MEEREDPRGEQRDRHTVWKDQEECREEDHRWKAGQ